MGFSLMVNLNRGLPTIIGQIIIQQVSITHPATVHKIRFLPIEVEPGHVTCLEQEILADMAEQRLETCVRGLMCSLTLWWCL